MSDYDPLDRAEVGRRWAEMGRALIDVVLRHLRATEDDDEDGET